MDVEASRKTWELENNIKMLPSSDEIFRYDHEHQRQILDAKPWKRDPRYFKDIKMSALSLLKMVMHARSGGNHEILGLLQGKVEDNTMIVMDAFALPCDVTGSPDYSSTYINSSKEVRRLENVIGWYHSHPGYGCWLSGIDVLTQMRYQTYEEPFVAIVVDPVRTVTAGKVCLGAFRTYPNGYKPLDEEPSEYQTIPLNRAEEFRLHCKQYYSLEVSYFKSALDQKLLDSLWNKHWVNTLASSGLLTNSAHTTGQINDISEKLEQIEASLSSGPFNKSDRKANENRIEDNLSTVTRDCSHASIELIHGLMAQIAKCKLFNKVGMGK